ncbi:MAG: family 43 glycosylhydrolase [Eubacteriales bacterium]|nr:family 43 glycosylhydrolase [Eubacteriales bacterium]MDD4511943.1 family 43 glycosylhydrolase [Eubacteriales bacterium]
MPRFIQKPRMCAAAAILVCLICLWAGSAVCEEEAPVFENVSVHDPSVILADDGYYYIFGSHMAAARSADLMKWEMISTNAQEGCTLFEDVQTELEDVLAYCRSNTFWAPDVCRLKDGRYYYYYCACQGSSPLSMLGVAVSDKIGGKYTDLGVILKSGYSGYDATRLPNVVDPCVFYDNDGRLWMVYGSYSGGIFILEMDDETGFPKEGQGYGKKLLGKNHSRIEGPYIMYSPETDYYYLFLSFGGLDSNGGYNIRVCRSKNPDGPYEDALGQDMLSCGGKSGTFFNDVDYEGYGVKLLGGYKFRALPEETVKLQTAYRSPGHNSAIYDEKTGRYFLFFHTRFANNGESFTVRVFKPDRAGVYRRFEGVHPARLRWRGLLFPCRNQA